ncbi:glycosyltransferase 87 family protein [Falsiroseomonas oryziterrae]|uniref:glycosyltransferase 87 family protein n=1 Tax=Falsiroseomonas oryziterrae TaxID=2911368 RepID=UPI001F014C0F|nr:glycosyltransferase 87 family protein [Roseomonas sp. NPKOSM-4]
MTGLWGRSWPWLLRTVAVLWIALAAALLLDHFRTHTAVGLTAGDGKAAFGGDSINFWSGARLALEGRLDVIYDFDRYHAFQIAVLNGPIHLYHYSYPPVALLLTWPLGLLPYLAAWAVWIFGGIALFLFVLHRAWPPGPFRTLDALLLGLAAPAVTMNIWTGQTGTWIAALIGGALLLLPRRPVLAGALLGLLVVKPQLAVLLPVALLAGRRWAALFACAGTAAALLLASALLFGVESWQAYLQRADHLRGWILEDGTGVQQLFTSVFATVRHLPTEVGTAYAAQGVTALAAAALVWIAWRRPAPQPARDAMLVLGTLLATPYVQVYDLVLAGFVPLWLLASLPEGDPRRPFVWAASAPLILCALVAPFISVWTGFGPAPLLILPAVAVAYLCLEGALEPGAARATSGALR